MILIFKVYYYISKLGSFLYIHIYIKSDKTLCFISKLGRQLAKQSGHKREVRFLFQRFLVTPQCFNAIIFRGSVPHLEQVESQPHNFDMSLDNFYHKSLGNEALRT